MVRGNRTCAIVSAEEWQADQDKVFADFPADLPAHGTVELRNEMMFGGQLFTPWLTVLSLTISQIFVDQYAQQYRLQLDNTDQTFRLIDQKCVCCFTERSVLHRQNIILGTVAQQIPRKKNYCTVFYNNF